MTTEDSTQRRRDAEENQSRGDGNCSGGTPAADELEGMDPPWHIGEPQPADGQFKPSPRATLSYRPAHGCREELGLNACEVIVTHDSGLSYRAFMVAPGPPQINTTHPDGNRKNRRRKAAIKRRKR